MNKKKLLLILTVAVFLCVAFPVTAAAKNYYVPHAKYIMRYRTASGSDATLCTHTAASLGYSTTQRDRIVVCSSVPTGESDAPFQWWGDDGLRPYTQGATTNPCPSNPNDTVNVWARFKYKITVTYDANGGTINGSSSKSETQEDIRIGREYINKTFYVSYTPTRSGYSFKGWKYNGSNVSVGSSIKPQARYTTLTAQWEAVSTPPIYTPPTPDPTPTPPAVEPQYANKLYVPAYVTKNGNFNVKSDNDYSEDGSDIKQITYQLRDGTTVKSSVTGTLSQSGKSSGMVHKKYKGKLTAPANLDRGNVNMIVAYNDGRKIEINKEIQLLDWTADYEEGVRYIGNGVLPNPKAKWWKDQNLRNKLIDSLKKLVPEETVKL